MKKRVLALILCLVMAAGLAACGSKESTEEPADDAVVEEEAAEEEADAAEESSTEGAVVEVSSWNLTDSTVIAAFDGWEALNTGITLEREVLDYEAYIQNLKIELASGEGPDVFMLQAGSSLTEFGEYLLDVEEYAKETWGDSWQDKFLELYLGMAQNPDGNYVGLPWGSTTGANFLFVDTATLASYGVNETPHSYDELKAATDAVRAQDGVAVVATVDQGWAAIDLFMTIGADINSEKLYSAIEGEVDWTDPELVQAFEIYQNCFEDGIFCDGQMGGVDKTLYFAQERTSPFMINGSWVCGHFESQEVYANALAAGAAYDVTTIDWNNDGTVSPVANSCEAIICVNKNSDNIDAAWQFASYLATDGQALAINDTLCTFPSTAGFELDVDNFQECTVELFEISNAKMSDGTAGYREMAYLDLKQAIIDQVQLLALGETTPEDAAAVVQEASLAQER